MNYGVFGGDDETRTHYLYNANVALSQMSYAPKCLIIITEFYLFVNTRNPIFRKIE